MSDSQNIIDKLKNQGLEPNLNQIKLISVLNRVDLKKRKIFKINRLKEDALDGIYIWGDVGRGKTLITKEYLSLNHDLRIKDFHYIDFMNFVHDELNNNSGSKNPLKLVTKSLCKSYDLLFIDEFQVEDVADAMIIGNLISELIEDGINIIITSNAHPNDLYKDGLQRKKFLDSMEILQQKVEVYELNAGIDYRTKTIIELNSFEKSHTNEEIQKLINGNVDSGSIFSSRITINDRDFECKQVNNNLIWIGFEDFFRQPTGTDDFIYMCNKYDWIFISDFIECDDDSLDIVRRFISFVDIAYKEKTKVRFFFNEQEISKTYSGQKLGIIWERCESRLKEMVLFDHLNQWLITIKITINIDIFLTRH